MEKLRKALDKENQKAAKYVTTAEKQHSGSSLQTGGLNLLGDAKMQLSNVLGSNHPLASKDLDSFAKNRGLIIGERVDYVAANQ